MIESCENCKNHQWNTRHDEAKYMDFFNRRKLYFLLTLAYIVSTAISIRIPNAVVMRNQIPKSYVDYDLYCNLVANDNPELEVFKQIPRTGAFEVSYKGLVSLLSNVIPIV